MGVRFTFWGIFVIDIPDSHISTFIPCCHNQTVAGRKPLNMTNPICSHLQYDNQFSGVAS